MYRALRFCVALVGTVIALYLVFLLLSPLLVGVAEWTTSGRFPGASVHLVALAAAALGTIPLATRCASGSHSLERLWTFALAAHLLTYLLVLPYFHVADTGVRSSALRLGSPGSLVYYATGYGLVVLALALSYLLVYRDGYALVTARLES